MLSAWIGSTETHIREAFRRAAAQSPVLFFMDEIDALGAARQISTSDAGGARQSFNNQVLQLMQCIDTYRSTPGFVLMAATNLLDVLDPALTREGRFDLKIRLDLPDDRTRESILRAQLAGKPCQKFELGEFAKATHGYSAARLGALVSQAATYAAQSKRRIEPGDLRRALAEMGGKDRPLVDPVEWEDIVIAEDLKQKITQLIEILNRNSLSEQYGIHPPTGMLLIGPPGTGKSLIARLIASQTRRSFYPLTSSDVLGGVVGESVKKLARVFERAKEHSPSIIFFDEMDGLLPAMRGSFVNHHDVQLVEQCLIEISNLKPENRVFLIGATNTKENIDPRVLRGGRFSEKFYLPLPNYGLRKRIFRKFIGATALSQELSLNDLTALAEGLSPADIEAVCNTAKRHALFRHGETLSSSLELRLEDFEKAIQDIRVTPASL
jgi:transitional endoplasmic reticulum ATPase